MASLLCLALLGFSAATDVDAMAEVQRADAALSRPWAEHVPMACVGERLWAAHPGGWAFRDGTNYYLLTKGGVGFDLELQALGQDIVPDSGTMHLSHVELSGGMDTLSVTGYKWIAQDDVLVSLVRIENTGAKPVTLNARVTAPTTSATIEGNRFSWSTPVAGMDVHFVGQAPGFVLQNADDTTPDYYLVEGEAPVEQTGSIGPDEKSAASGGQVLGSNFGASAGHHAAWVIDVKAPVKDAVLAIRYARADAGDAEFKIVFDNGKTTVRHGFKQTSGWGDAPGDFAVASFPLGDLAPGPQRVEAIAVGDGANVNIDALTIRPASMAFAVPQAGETALVRALSIASGATETLLVAVAAGTQPGAPEDALGRLYEPDDPLAEQEKAYFSWLADNVPLFTSSDSAWYRMYWHRAASIVRKNLFRVGEGRLTRWAIAEGRWDNSWYPNLISYGAGHQIRETRWLRDPQYVRDIITTWCENERENGIFPNFIRPNELGKTQYTDWITSTVWDAHCVAPDTERLKEWAPALKRNIDGWLAEYDKDGDGLLLVDSHWWTGMEWQPSFFYFTDYDKDHDRGQLERVDLTAYVYGSAKNLALICGAIGDNEGAQRYAAIAEKIKAAVTSAMWDPGTSFIYSVEPVTGERAMVKEIVGVYPFYFGMFSPGDGGYANTWRAIVDPAEFWTKWPVASATIKCPAYSQDELFNGKKATICMWNGPTWPHANSIVLSAMAETLRTFTDPGVTAADFQHLLQSFIDAQFREQDTMFPWTGEFYSGDTGAWRTRERDYDHSTFIDVLIADLAGIRPSTDNGLTVRPMLSKNTPDFYLDRIRYHGRELTVGYLPEESNAPAQPDGKTGFRLYVDGKLVHEANDWTDCPPGRPGVKIDFALSAPAVQVKELR